MPQTGFRPLFVITALVAALACGGGGNASNDEANRPAVVRGPSVVLRPDTAPPDTSDVTDERITRYRAEIYTTLSVLSTSVYLGDARTATSIYAPDAVFETPDSTFRSALGAARGLGLLMLNANASEMRRNSMFIEILPDSQVSDSGLYVFARRRDTVVTEITRSWYKTIWRLKPGVGMVIQADRIHAGKGFPAIKPSKSQPPQKRGVSGASSDD
jgi:hypothetical protein